MVTVTKIFEFEAAHHLPDYEGKCKNFHGHSYKLEVEVSGYVRDDRDEYPTMVVDFGRIKSIVNRKVLELYDHANLNEYFTYPTAEHMVQEIAVTLQEFFIVERVRLWETSSSYAEWRR